MIRTGNLSRRFWLYIKKDIKLYGLVLSAWVIGAILAVVLAFGLSELTQRELALYLADYFENMYQGGADAKTMLQAGLLVQLRQFGILFLLSLMIVGTPLVLGFAVFQSFMQSFTLIFLFKTYSARAILFLLAGVLPHALVLIPCYGVLLVESIKFTMHLIQDKQNIKWRLRNYFLCLVGLLLLSLAGVLLQVYVEPMLIRMISAMFLGS